jgi:tRNA G18 (ribose-2'-O)-methylase SpoU
MISSSKFCKLRKITKYFRIASELKSLRDALIANEIADLTVLSYYSGFLKDSGEKQFTDELTEITELKDKRILLEKIHFLYHRIRDNFDYPDNEAEFVKSSSDSKTRKFPETDLIVVLENIRSAHNAGSIIRSCECFGVKELILCGITPGTDHEGVKKTSKGTEKDLKIIRFTSASEAAAYLREQNYEIIGAETGDGSVDLRDFDPEKKTAVIFGNEELGLTSEAVGLCDRMASVEMRGKKNSLNVANCASIFIYDITNKIS